MARINSLILKEVIGKGGKFKMPLGKDDAGMPWALTTDYPPEEFTAEAFAATQDFGGTVSISGKLELADGNATASRKEASKARVLRLAALLKEVTSTPAPEAGSEREENVNANNRMQPA